MLIVSSEAQGKACHQLLFKDPRGNELPSRIKYQKYGQSDTDVTRQLSSGINDFLKAHHNPPAKIGTVHF